MVAISLYRGNLHRVPDVPRRWLMPNPKISLKDFRLLLLRRSKALSLLRDATTSSNPNPSSPSKAQFETPTTVNVSAIGIQSEALKVSDNGEGPSRKDDDHKESEPGGSSLKKQVDGPDSFVDSKAGLLDKASKPVDGGTSMENQVETVIFVKSVLSLYDLSVSSLVLL